MKQRLRRTLSAIGSQGESDVDGNVSAGGSLRNRHLQKSLSPNTSVIERDGKYTKRGPIAEDTMEEGRVSIFILSICSLIPLQGTISCLQTPS